MKSLTGTVLIATIVGIFSFGWGCRRGKSKNKAIPPIISLPLGQAAAIKTDIHGILVASLASSSSEAQLVKASASSNIPNVVIGFPSSSVPLATDIVIREIKAVEKGVIIDELGLEASMQITSSGEPVLISTTEAFDLTQPMIVGLPLPESVASSQDPSLNARMGVVYRTQVQETGEQLIGVVPAGELTIENGKLLYASQYFGWFQLVIFDQPITAKENAATLPIHLGLEVLLEGLPLTSCGRADLGHTVYVKEESIFKYCGPNGWTAIDMGGLGGSTSSGLPIMDGSDNKIGYLLSLSGSNALLKIGSQSSSNLGMLWIDMPSGKFSGTVCDDASPVCPLYYLSNDCSGTPHTEGTPAKNAVIPASSSVYYRAQGNEAAAPAGPFLSSWRGSSGCIVTGWGSFSAYSISASYAFPSGIPQPPYTAPLYLGD